ncbi:DinB family protein [Glutamicibacter halophytocola]|uniref:Maleylpyruvate isomerase N-terminal domain-containing protein n=1 Tax=Glutamicibacter halophytocola TaxID=1933880 RepID=A0AA94XTC6_9MICC|nr:maleylpyruvate isomerase N-terminal domain-containing protein [Glutamicibacter halophytocola]UUX59629.1 maleylpyruvate isomerase N-terminal domain-containing protein [Glutamicibacter halophytocola]
MSEIVPDQKNWTFVLDSVCPQCRYDVRTVAPADVIANLPDGLERYIAVLSRPQARLRTSPSRWSDQEYVAHVAHMLVIMDGRLDLMLEHDEPVFPNWDQDQAAEEGNYNALEPEEVAAWLRSAASKYAEKLRSIDEASYSRRGLRSNGSAFTVESLNQYAWHDFVHHLWDLDSSAS